MNVAMKAVAALLFLVGAANAFVSPSAFTGRSMAAGRVRARAGVAGAAAVGAVCSRPSMTVIDVSPRSRRGWLVCLFHVLAYFLS